ncbi:uncharacterized protein N7483_007428 [Penicillium malachiteum]|uniref:uncharacterized protein n=1 Tax=Penicillium malachiteum TaxID=1324776 RepID=UPI00254744B8|nr:uncharacterized protein N7483_007428 [Penicillium malachiteum]KAJ5726071.1 hypothetical protein N7483_007428 [Penicillium malachiteum]
MRILNIAVLAVTLLVTSASAGISELEAVLPKCALQCMASSISQSSCAPTDQACLCTDTTYTEALEECVLLSCTIRQSLTTKNVTTSACAAPIRNRTKIVSCAGVAGGIIAVIAFLLRMFARLRCCGGTFGMDDWTMMLTICLVIPLSSLSVVLANAGLGKDMWTLPFENITRILCIYFWDELLYLSILPMTKISICCFYLRIFPERRFRIITYCVIGINVAYLITFILISVFQCRPLPGAWLHWDGEGDYKCNHINAQGWSAAAINMILDIVVMALPLRQLYNLNLSLRKKIYVMCMFGLGLLFVFSNNLDIHYADQEFSVTLVSILRLNSLIHFASTTNLTWDYVSIGYWSTIECDVGVICACLPAIRSLLRRLSPGLFGDTENVKSYGLNSQSRGTASRYEGPIYVHHDIQVKSNDGKFYQLGDMDNSSKAHLPSQGA